MGHVVVSAGPTIDLPGTDGASLVGEERVGPLRARLGVRAAPRVGVKKITPFCDSNPSRSRDAAPLDVTVDLGPSGCLVTAEWNGSSADVVSPDRVRPWAMTRPLWVVSR